MSKKEKMRRVEIRNLVIMIAITLIIGVIALTFYITRDRTQYISYNENSNIDYKVNLKQNEFYKEKYLEKGKSYVASLIDSVSTNFKYDLDFASDISYKYSYRIAVEVDVKDDKDDSSIYHFSEDLVTKNIAMNSGDLHISEDLNVKYDEYNNLINRFRDVYELNNTSGVLNLNLYINVQDIDKSNTTILKDKKVSSLSIPLTEKTVSVDIGDESITNSSNKIELSRPANYTWLLIISLFYIIISVVYIVYLIIYIMRTRTAQMIYEKEIKSIMNNYDSYIQKISGS